MTTHYDALESLPDDANHLSFRPALPDIDHAAWWAKESRFATPMSAAEGERIIRDYIGPRGCLHMLDSIAKPDARCVVVISDDHDYYHLPDLYLVI